MKNYDKLVRDLIPEIIEGNNQKCTFRILSDEEFLFYAEKKLDEELQEYHEDRTLEELIDIIEIIEAIAKAKGVSWDEMEKMRIKKQTERGGFSKKIFLHCVE